MKDVKISNDIKYIGADDKDLDLFESQYIVPNGMAYNSYLIKDEKTVVMDTIDERKTDEWLENLTKELDGVNPDYLVVSHMEPDHAYNIGNLISRYPNIKIVGNLKTFQLLNQFFDIPDLDERKVVVNEGDELNIGSHTLKFIMAPMVHWPEVMFTYEEKEKVLFSADAFGKFGTLDTDEDWACEARRYYFNICGKYGMQVQAVLKKVANLEVKTICPLHGPILKENLEYYINKYDIWSKYEPEAKGIFIVHASVHGNTANVAKELKKMLEEKNPNEKVSICDLTREDWAEAIEDAFKYDRVVFAASSYNMDLFPPMKHLLDNLKEKNFQNRKVGLIENGSWAPSAGRVMKSYLDACKNITYCEPDLVTVKSTLKEDSKAKLEQLASSLLK